MLNRALYNAIYSSKKLLKKAKKEGKNDPKNRAVLRRKMAWWSVDLARKTAALSGATQKFRAEIQCLRNRTTSWASVGAESQQVPTIFAVYEQSLFVLEL